MSYANDDEEFFKERLDMFMQKSLNDISEFAKREGRDPECMRKSVAEWHASWLFNSTLSDSEVQTSEVNRFLEKISDNLQYLHNVTGQHSLLLVVDPAHDEDREFVGGTSTGITFWNGLRGGGSIGARQFKQQCRTTSSSTVQASSSSNPEPAVNHRQTPAVVLKNNLYNEMRSALRLASGNSSAEMKWSKPEKLATLGVELVGWPPSVPFKNPSRMSQQEMTLIRTLLMNNTISFVRIGAQPEANDSTVNVQTEDLSDAVDLSWAIQDDAIESQEPPTKRQRQDT